MAIENRWNAVLCDLRPADTLSFGPGVLYSASDASPYHCQFQLTENACHLEKGFAHRVRLSVAAIQRDIHFWLLGRSWSWRDIHLFIHFWKKRTKKRGEGFLLLLSKMLDFTRNFGLLEVPLQQAFQGLAVTGFRVFMDCHSVLASSQ